MDIWIDPATAGYVVANGAPVRDPADGLANAVYVRLMTPLGGFWADPTLGSRLHELQREKDLARVELMARQYSEQALQPILDDGRATAIVVATERPHDGRLLLAIQVTAASGQVVTFKHPVQVL